MLTRVIDGIVYVGKPSADRWKISEIDLGNGHREACVQRATDWHDDGPLDPDSILAQVLRGEREDPEAEFKEAANRKRAARRAKTVVRRRCKALGLDTLLTLTYRGLQLDKALCELHLKLFLEKMRRAYRAIGREFAYVCCFEEQKRGAWHVHLAVQRLPVELVASNGVKVKSFNIVRALWRAVTGEWGGNIDVSRRKGTARKSAAKVAAYISKYVLKMFEEGDDHSKRYRWSKCDLPKPTVTEVRADSLGELMARVVSDFACEDGRVPATVWLSRFADVFFVAGESPPRRGGVAFT